MRLKTNQISSHSLNRRRKHVQGKRKDNMQNKWTWRRCRNFRRSANNLAKCEAHDGFASIRTPRREGVSRVVHHVCALSPHHTCFTYEHGTWIMTATRGRDEIVLMWAVNGASWCCFECAFPVWRWFTDAPVFRILFRIQELQRNFVFAILQWPDE